MSAVDNAILTTVVNLKYSTHDVYVGREGHGYSGRWGNPHTLAKRFGEICRECERQGNQNVSHDVVGSAAAAFKVDFSRRVEQDASYAASVRAALAGKRLGCFCVDNKGRGECHAKVYADWLNLQLNEGN